MAEAMPGKSQELGLNNEQGPVSFLRNRNSSLSTIEEIYVAACGSFCVSAVPSEILKLV
jgi:hypothetical protein